MKSPVALLVSLSLWLMPMSPVFAEIANPENPVTPYIAEKAYVPEAVAAAPVVISYTAGLGTSHVSTLSGAPLPHVMEGSSSATSISLSSGRIAVKYNVKTAGSRSGLTVDFDDYATGGQETGNLSAVGQFTVGLTGNAHTVNVRFEDADGNTAGYQLTQISSSTQRYWVMDLSLIQADMDLSRVSAIHFYVEPGNTTASYASGTFYLRLNGTDVSAPALPQLTAGTPTTFGTATVTLSGTKEAYSSVYLKGVLVVPANSATTWTAAVTLTAEGNNTVSFYSKSAMGVATTTQNLILVRDTTAPAGTVKINNGATATNSVSVTLNLTASDARSGVDTMRFSVDGGATWTEWEAFAATRAVTLPSRLGTNTVSYQVRDGLGNTATYTDTITNNDVNAACLKFSADLASLLTKTAIPANFYDGYFQSRENFQWALSTYTAAQRTQLLSGLSARDQALAKMLFATTQVIAPELSDAQLKTNAASAPAVTGFTATDFKSNVTILEGMDPQSVMGFAALLATPHFSAENPYTTWASQSWALAVMDARYNALVRGSVTAKVLMQENVMSVPLKTHVYFTWSGAPDIWINLPSVAITLEDVPALTRLQSSAFEIYRTGATRALAGAVAPTPPVLDPATPTVFGQKIVTISGTKAAYSSVYVNGILVAPADTSLAWTAMVTLASEGSNTVTLQAKSILGVACAMQNIILRRDTVPPTGSIKINNGAASTGTTAVTLNLTAADATSGVDQMRFSVDGGQSWSGWEAFAATRDITLTPGYGTKEVQYQVCDKVQNIATFKDTIVYEFMPATPVVTSPVPAYTNATQLVLTGTKEAQTYLYINGVKYAADFNATAWTATVSLSTDGTKTFSVTVRTNAGKASAAAVVTTVRDRVVPTGTIKINNGATATGTTDVTLNLTAADTASGVAAVQFSVDGGAHWTGWEAFAATRAITLTPGYGTKAVQYQILDKAGNVSTTYSDTISYDFMPATPVVTSDVPAATNQTSIVISGTKDAQTSILVDGVVVVPLNGTTTWTATLNLTVDGLKTFAITSQTSTGTASAALSLKILRDRVVPTGSIKINNGAVSTDSRNVTLNLTAADTVSGVDKVRFSVDDGDHWTEWESFAATRAISVLGEDGTKKVSYQILDKAGNSSIIYSDTITLTLPPIPVPTQPSLVTVQAGDRRLWVQNRLADDSLDATVAYVQKGVNWSPSSIGSVETNALAEFVKAYKKDLFMMSQMGVNTVRVFHDFGTGPDAIKILDEMWTLGIKVIMAVDAPPQGGTPDLASMAAVVNAYKNHPAILMWSVGNEWNYNKYYGRFTTLEQSAAFTEQVAAMVKSLDTNHPVTTVLADIHLPGYNPLSAEAFPYLTGTSTKDIVNTICRSVDVWGTNLYRTNSFQDVSQQWKSISDKPFYIAEFGADSYDHRDNAEDQTMQAQVDAQMWDEAYFDLSAERTDGALIGAIAFEWNDEWYKGGNASVHNISSEPNSGQLDGVNDEEWFGIVDINRNVKQVYATLQGRFTNPTTSNPTNATPVVTVTSQGNTYYGSSDVTLGDKSVFYRPGAQYGGRGITVAIIDPNTGIRLSDVRVFDTHITGPAVSVPTYANTRAMIDYIKGLPAGTLLAISVGDEAGFTYSNGTPGNHPIIEEAYKLFESLGSEQVRNVKFRYGWAFITKKGERALAEAVGTSATTKVTAQATLSLALNPDAGRRPAGLSATSSLVAPLEADLSSAATPVMSVTAKSSGVSNVTLDGKTILRRPANQVTSRGVQVVAVDPKLGASAASVRSFNSESGGDALSSYLQSFSDGTVFTVSMTKTSGESQPRSVDSAMESLGSKKIRKVSALGSWAMIAVKGQGVLAEAYSDPRMPVTLQAQLKPLLSSAANKS